MAIDTGANVTLVRTDVLQKLYPKPDEVQMKPISLQTETGGGLKNLLFDQEKSFSDAKSIEATYGNISAKSSEDYGRRDLIKHRINTSESSPIKQSPHHIPFARRQEAETFVKEMLDQNIIEPYSSSWVSTVVLVKNKDGSTKFCVDYRKLNDITKKDPYPFLALMQLWIH
ncbi:K02A2.6-like [Cordylochernes scorpioides]|uniref:K02A2.6-like n=1 Tax=Cordylochernes scorpioides TaxID=51811 RepID=A0ABY6LQ07_9ARAC|nr:K02A2.6-like [Cordylochernes scorpioides]